MTFLNWSYSCYKRKDIESQQKPEPQTDMFDFASVVKAKVKKEAQWALEKDKWKGWSHVLRPRKAGDAEQGSRKCLHETMGEMIRRGFKPVQRGHEDFSAQLKR